MKNRIYMAVQYLYSLFLLSYCIMYVLYCAAGEENGTKKRMMREIQIWRKYEGRHVGFQQQGVFQDIYKWAFQPPESPIGNLTLTFC